MDLYLGDLTNEIAPKDENFVSRGPKNNYLTDKGKTTCRVCGLTLHSDAVKMVNVDTLVNMVKGFGPETVTFNEPHKIMRNTMTKQLLTKSQKKDYRVVYNKRARVKNFGNVLYGINTRSIVILFLHIR